MAHLHRKRSRFAFCIGIGVPILGSAFCMRYGDTVNLCAKYASPQARKEQLPRTSMNGFAALYDFIGFALS
jgi:hypothetical protein